MHLHKFLNCDGKFYIKYQYVQKYHFWLCAQSWQARLPMGHILIYDVINLFQNKTKDICVHPNGGTTWLHFLWKLSWSINSILSISMIPNHGGRWLKVTIDINIHLQKYFWGLHMHDIPSSADQQYLHGWVQNQCWANHKYTRQSHQLYPLHLVHLQTCLDQTSFLPALVYQGSLKDKNYVRSQIQWASSIGTATQHA